MLFADSSPKYVIICKTSPLLADLSGSTKRSGIEVGEDPEGNLVRENGEGVDSNDVGELVCEKG